MSAAASGNNDSTSGPAFVKGSFCGVCKKSKKDGGDLSDSKLLTCSRCKIAKYCSQVRGTSGFVICILWIGLTCWVLTIFQCLLLLHQNLRFRFKTHFSESKNLF